MDKSFNFKQIFDIDELRQICQNFTQLTGAGTAIVDLEGNILIETVWQVICTQFYRVNNKTKKCCIESDTILASQLQKGEKYNIYKCKNGLIDVAIPIVVDNVHVANLFTGQFLDESADIDFFKKQAKTHNFNEKNYLDALDMVHIWSEEEIKKTIDFLVQLTETIGNIGLKNLNTIKNLKEIENNRNELEMIIENMGRAFALHEMIFDVDGNPIDYKFVSINRAFKDMTGFDEKIVGKKVSEVMIDDSSYWIKK